MTDLTQRAREALAGIVGKRLTYRSADIGEISAL
jgi:hypothetical protein